MDKQWFPAAGILLADHDQFPTASGTSARQNNSIRLVVLTDTSGGINSIERELEALGRRRAGALSTEAAGGQESPSMPGPSGRIKPEPAASALTTSTAHPAVESQPVSSEAKPLEEILAPGTLEANAMSSPQPSPERGPERKFIKASTLRGTAPASATLEKIVAAKPTQRLIRTSLYPIFVRPPCLLCHTSSPTVQIPAPGQRDGHSRPEASSTVALAPRTSSGLPTFPCTPNTLKATEPLLLSSSGSSGLDLTSQAITMGSRSSENTIALGTHPVFSGTSVLLLPSATSPSHPSSLYSPPHLSASPPSSSPPPTSFSFFPLPSSVPVPGFPVARGARNSPKPSVSVTAPSTTDSSIRISNLAPLRALQPSRPGPWLPIGPIHMPTLSLQHFSKPPSAPQSFTRSSGDPDPTQSSPLPHPGQDVSLQDLSSSAPGPSHVTRSVTFRITTAVWNLVPMERLLLNKLICYQLQLTYHEAFSSFKNVSALLFRSCHERRLKAASLKMPGSTRVKASLVFGLPDPSALEILWVLYRKVKSSRWSLGHLSLADHSLSSDGYNLTDLMRETINISFTVMRPFLPQLLLPGSQPFILLEKHVLQLVTHEVSRFYKADPQDRPLLLFSNVKEWVSIYMEYKFKRPIPTHLQGLASHLARRITDPTLQKSSMVANGKKADLVLYETWLLILGHPFTKALENKTSSESQELRGLLTKWLTSALQPLQNFGQVVVEEFWQEPLSARVQAAFFGAAPTLAIIQDHMCQALSSLQDTEGLQLEMFTPVHGTPSSRASRGPGCGLVLNLQFITSLLVLLEQHAFRIGLGLDPMTAPPEFRCQSRGPALED